MIHPTDPNLLVPRTCTTHDDQNNKRTSRTLAEFRDVPAYVLLGDPGAGKTSSFEQEATATHGHYIRARSFAALDPSLELTGKTLFIDGLDEMRAGGGDGRTPLDHVRRHLDRLGRPHFRLSCREADWYGDSDRAALLEAAPGGTLTVLHLDPLNDADIRLLLERKFAITDPVGFIQKADQHGLAELLRNPQTLALLAKAVGATTWPDSRAATYDLACRELLRETNPEHRAAKRNTAPPHDALLDAAGFLCAVQLLAGISGFALDDDAANGQHIPWRELTPPHELPLSSTLASSLFQRDEREQQRIPVHRSIAEYLSARYLAELIDEQGLPIGRIIALLAGEDGGIVADLRGLAAWLAVHCHNNRAELIERDPLGIVMYGDVRSFPIEDKHRVLAALRNEAEHNAHFRSEDWSDAPFGALATPNMVPLFQGMLTSTSRSGADLAVLDCILDALRYGSPLTQLTTADNLPQFEAQLDTIARDTSYPSPIRHKALEILLRNLPRNADRLISFARKVHAGAIVDEDDELLGLLLTKLFPEHIRAEEVFDFLHEEKDDRLIGTYRMFWSHYLLEKTPDSLLPVLLDKLSKRAPMLHESLEHLQAERMAGRLLVRTLETYGDTVDDAQLYEWLGAGLDKYSHQRIDGEDQRRINAWLAVRPERYKAILLVGIDRCIGKENIRVCLYDASSRLYSTEPPTDIIPWYLEQAAVETHTDLKQHFFAEALTQLIRQDGQGCLTLDALDYLDPWMARHPEFEATLKFYVSCDLDDWRRDNADRERESAKKRDQKKSGWCNHFREHIAAIREGSAHPGILHDLAKVYLIEYLDTKGETPHERLADFLNNDDELIAAAYSGFLRCLGRDDLPSVAEIVDLEANGRMHYIRQPCLVGMNKLYSTDPEATLHLGDEVLRKLLAFRLTWGIDIEVEWYTALVRSRPDLVAEVFISYALPLLRKGREHLSDIGKLTRNDDHAVVARIALPDLLNGFPLRARNNQLSNILDPLLKAALHHLESSALAEIISAKLAKGSMSAAQRVYWLACGLMLLPEEYEKILAAHIGTSKSLRNHLGAFLHERRPKFNATLPESTLALLIELLAPDSPPERPMGSYYISDALETAEVVRGFIATLGGNPGDAAQKQLECLLHLPQLAPWHDRLQHAAHTQRIARRKATFRHLDATKVCRTLANREPSNAADLAALTYAHLRDLSRKIRDGSTNDYRQYWNDDARGKPEHPKQENACRDILLSDLMERLGRLGIDTIKEGYYAEDKRADIRVSSGGASGFNVPIEIKKDSHSDLWRAIREQLIGRYTRDPGTDGFGIYLVFWFGGNKMPLHEGKKPRSAAELEQQLCATLNRNEAKHIAVCVIDCALP